MKIGAMAAVGSIVAAAGAYGQVAPIQGANALSPPAARHLVRMAPGGGQAPAYLLAIQGQQADSAHPGLNLYRSNDEGQTWSFYAPINPSSYATNPSASERDTTDMVNVGNDIAMVYSYDGPAIVPDATLDPLHKVFFQWWRYNGAGDWTASTPVPVFTPTPGIAYHRAEIAVDSLGRIWVQAWQRGTSSCDPNTQLACHCRDTANGDNYANTLVLAVSTNNGVTFAAQPSIVTTLCRAGGRIESLGSKLMMVWNDYSGNQGGSVVVTKVTTRNDSDPLSSWAPAANAFPDQPADGIYHGAALSSVPDGAGGLHLIYKDQNSLKLWYRYFNGTSFGAAQLVDPSHDDWALQAATTRYNGDLFVFVNHLVNSDLNPWPAGINLNNYEIRLWKLSRGWGTYDVLDAANGRFKGYPAAAASLPSTVTAIPVAFGDTPDANTPGTARVVRAATGADFQLSAANPSVSNLVGGSSTNTITVTPQGGFAGSVCLSASNLPAGATAGFNPSCVSVGPGSASSILTLSGGAAGSYTVNVTGVSGAISHSTSFGWSINSGGTPVSSLTDPFNSIDPAKWSTSATAGTAAASAGTLTLTPNVGTAATAVFVTSVGKYSLTGSSLHARVTGVVANGGVNNKLVLDLDGGSNQLGWWFEGNTLYGYYLKNGVETDPALLTYDASAHAWWRIRETSGTVYWETSADGSTWSIRGQTSTASLGFSIGSLNVQFNVKAFGAGAPSAAPAKYTSLNATSGPVPVASFHDAFNNGIDPAVWSTAFTAGTGTASGGVLTLTPNAGTSATSLFMTTVNTYTLNNSSASVKVTGVVSGNINNKFVLYKDGANQIGWWYESGTLYGYYLVNGVETDPALLSYNATTHAYWKISASGGNVIWSTSADGVTYTQQGITAVSNLPFSLDALNVQFNVRAFGTGASSTAPATYTLLNQ